MLSKVLVSAASFSLAIFFFSVPLIVKYHVYKPEHRHIASGDSVNINGKLSSSWCDSVDIASDSTRFEAYLFDREPVVDRNSTERSFSVIRTVLPNQAQEFWGLHLLEGSSLNVTACSRLLIADITILKSFSNLKKCLQEHEFVNSRDGSSEESESLSESAEDTSSISSSQGVISNDSANPYICNSSLSHTALESSNLCRRPWNDVPLSPALSLLINETAMYFFVLSSKSYLDILPNELQVEFRIDRTKYDTSNALANCSLDGYCRLQLDFGAEYIIVLKLENDNGTLKNVDIIMSCHPRGWVFLGFYSIFFVIFFLCALQ